MLAPIVSFLAEEGYSYLPGKKSESIFLNEFPKVNPEWQKEGLLERFTTLLEMRTKVAKVLEDLRRDKVIGSSLDAQVTITAQGPVFKLLQQHQKDLRQLFIVSMVKIQEGSEEKIVAQHADGTKCVRCWHYSDETGKDQRFPGVCPKCVEALA